MGIGDDYYIDEDKWISTPPKIENGSVISIGKDHDALIMIVDQHFNWFQKIMIKWCFGIKVRNYRQ